MFTTILALIAPFVAPPDLPRPDCPLVRLADLKQFAVTTEDAAWTELETNWRHFGAVDKAASPDHSGGQYPAGYLDWAMDCKWCRQCWSELRAALQPTNPADYRLLCLNDLRKLLGDDAYFAGCMPTATPGWHFGGLVPAGVTPPSKR